MAGRGVNICRAANRVSFTKTGSQASGDLDQQFVTRRMPQTVVYDFKLVYIHEEDGEFVIRVTPGTDYSLLQAIYEERPVRQVGQAIVERAVHQHFFRPF